MNFGFKSTLIRLNQILTRQLQNISHATWIILINITSASIIGWLYLTNQFLPAVIGSKPHGSEYILLMKIAIAVKLISTAYAVVYLLVLLTRSMSFTQALLLLPATIAAKASERVQRHVYPLLHITITALRIVTRSIFNKYIKHK
jgi:hypothetical protein